MTRRTFVISISALAGLFAAGFYSLKKILNFEPITLMNSRITKKNRNNQSAYRLDEESLNADAACAIYESKNGSPEQNMNKVLDMMGGIESIIDKNDIVILKPNGQQISHNMTNTNTMKELIDQILNMSGFGGEIIIAENHHHDDDNSAGWTTTNRNGDYNLNELVQFFNERGFKNVTKYHWRDGGSVLNSKVNKANAGRIVSGPEEGDGYVWTEMEYSYRGKKVKMSYPIFTSTYSGVTVDFKHGAWRDGAYTDQPVKFINISSLRNHSNAGVTASIKNYLGIIDMSCGYHGTSPRGYYNFHYIAVDWPSIGFMRKGMKSFITSSFVEKQKTINKIAKFVGPQNGALGGAVGFFMTTIRKADMNIIAAEFAGHEGRHMKPAHTKTVLASTDPVALDYYAGKYLLYPLGGKRAEFNNPDNHRGTFRKYLQECHTQGGGELDESKMLLHKYLF